MCSPPRKKLPRERLPDTNLSDKRKGDAAATASPILLSGFSSERFYPFLFSKSFMNAVSARTPSIGKAL